MSCEFNETNYELACEALTDAAEAKFGDLTDKADAWCTRKISEGWLEDWLEYRGLLR